jgi:hypothetical protein
MPVGQAHRGIGLVDVLAAGAGSAVGIDAHIGRVDFDIDRFIDFGIDEYAGERGMAAAGRVERRFAHQAMHAGLGAQETVGIFAFDLQRRGLDAGDLALGLFHHLDLEALALAIAQVLAQQHRCPVLGFGAAGAGLDIDEAVVGVHRVGKHAPEFQRFDLLAQRFGIGLDRLQRVVVVFLARHVEQIAGIAQSGIDFSEGVDHAFERLLFLAQCQRALLVVPDGRVFEFLVDLLEFLGLQIEVKDTSEVQLPGW